MSTTNIRMPARVRSVAAVCRCCPEQRGRLVRAFAPLKPVSTCRPPIRIDGPMLRPRSPGCWWELSLPAGCWLTINALTLACLRAMMRAHLVDRAAFRLLMRASGRLSRAGFNSWRFWEGAWR